MMTPAEAAAFYDSYEEYERKREPSASEFDRKQEKEVESAARQLAFAAPYLRPGDTLCDIGASYGHFLRLAQPRVSCLVAVEPNPRSRAALTQLGARAYSWIEELAREGVRLDAVAMFHTFEHLPDPLAFLATLRVVLNPQARLFLEVPNARDALLTLYSVEAFRDFYYQSMHCCYYDAGSLTHAVSRSGFSRLAIEHIQRYSIGNHLQWLARGLPGGDVEFDRTFKEIDAPYRSLLCGQQMSDTLLAAFQLDSGAPP